MAIATVTRAAARPSDERPRRRGRLAAGCALAAGLLWPVYGWFEMSMPFGVDSVYDDGRGFEVVIDQNLFALYSLPGACALWATAMTLLHITSGSSGTRARWAHGLARLVICLALVGMIGIGMGLVPLFFAPQAFGTPLLGVAAWLAGGLAVSRALRRHLRCLAIGALAFLGLWPAVWALEVLSPEAAAALIAVFGIGWAASAPAAIEATRRRTVP